MCALIQWKGFKTPSPDHRAQKERERKKKGDKDKLYHTDLEPWLGRNHLGKLKIPGVSLALMS